MEFSENPFLDAKQAGNESSDIFEVVKKSWECHLQELFQMERCEDVFQYSVNPNHENVLWKGYLLSRKENLE